MGGINEATSAGCHVDAFKQTGTRQSELALAKAARELLHVL